MTAYAADNSLRALWLAGTGSQVSYVSGKLRCLPLYGQRIICIHEKVPKIDLRRFNAAYKAVRRAGRYPYWPRLLRAVKLPISIKEVKARSPGPHQSPGRSL